MLGINVLGTQGFWTWHGLGNDVALFGQSDRALERDHCCKSTSLDSTC